MTLAKYFAPNMSTALHASEKVIVIHRLVPRKRGYLFFDAEYSDTYFVTPAFIPPLAILWIIAIKFVSCPTRASPTGPNIGATILTLTNPVIILTMLETAVKDDTLTKSVVIKRLILVRIILFTIK